MKIASACCLSFLAFFPNGHPALAPLSFFFGRYTGGRDVDDFVAFLETNAKGGKFVLPSDPHSEDDTHDEL